MNEPGAIRIDRDVLEISGDQALDYLQGQLSQDVEAIAVGDSAWSLVLQPSGKVDTWLRLHRVGDQEFVADLDAGFAATARARLERFKLRTAVEFETLSGWSMVSIKGPDASSRVVEAELSATVTWPGFEGVDHLGPTVSPPDGIHVFEPGEYEAMRISAGWPRMGAELTPDTIPGEAGAVLIATSVSFTKGCYTGQELVARINSRGGNVPRPIRILSGAEGAAPQVGASVMLDETEIGTVTSSVGGRAGQPALALATVLRKVEVGSAVTVDAVPLTVHPLPA